MKRLSLTLLIVLGGYLSASAQTTIWTNLAGNHLFSNPLNWTSGVPVSGSTFGIGSGDFLGLDIGDEFVTSGITIQSSVLADLETDGASALRIQQSLGGVGIDNLGLGGTFNLSVVVEGNQSWNIGGGAFTFGNTLDIASGALTINLGNGGTFNFGMSEAVNWNGSIAFLGDIGDTSIPVLPGALTVEDIGAITINGQNAILENGYLIAVPEPATVATWLGVAGLVGTVCVRRYRSRRAVGLAREEA